MLFNNTSDIKKFAPVNVSLEYESITPFINIVERDYLKKLIGDAMYTEISAYTQSSTAIQKGLLKLCKEAVIHLALWKWSMGGSVSVSDIGITRAESEKQKSAYKYQEDSFRDAMKDTGFFALDAVLEYLETNISDFSTFSSSANYTVLKSNFINTTAAFDEIYDISNSRLVFLRLKRFITMVQDFDIIPGIGRETYDILLAIANDTQGSGSGEDEYTKQNAVIGYIRKAVAFFAVSRAILELNVNITDKGFFFEQKEGAQNTFQKTNNLYDNQLSTLANNAKQNGTAYLEYAIAYMKDNLDIFPEFEASTAYDENEGNAGMNFDNTDKKIIRV